MPIRGDRQLVEIAEITRDFNGTEQPIICKMKRGIKEWFDGLEELTLDSPRLTGTFSGSGSNSGATFYRRIGGFRESSWTLKRLGKFTITEYYFDDNGDWVNSSSEFKTITFGMPSGCTVNEIIDFLIAKVPEDEKDSLTKLITPAGVSVDLSFPTST
jgi:hypothetical protein